MHTICSKELFSRNIYAVIFLLGISVLVCIGIDWYPAQSIAAAGAIVILALTAKQPEVGVYLIVALIPLENLWYFLGGSLLLKAFGGLVVLLWMAKRTIFDRAQIFTFSRQLELALIFILFTIFSSLWADNWGNSHRNIVLLKIMGLTSLMIFYLMFSDVINTEKEINTLIIVYFYSAVLTSSLAILQYFTDILKFLDQLNPSVADAGRSIGGSADPNELCAMILAAFPIGITFIVKARTFLRKTFYLLTQLILVAAVYTTESRAGFIGLAGVAMACLWLLPNRRNRILIGTLIISLLLASWMLLGQGLAKRFQELELFGGPHKLGRTALYQIAWSAIKERPLFGHGLGSFPYLVPNLQLNTPGAWFLKGKDSKPVAHNSYLTVWAETGTIGLLLYLSLLACPAIKFYKLSRSPPIDISKIVNRGVLLGYIAILYMAISLNMQYYKIVWIFIILADVMFRLSSHTSSRAEILTGKYHGKKT